MKTNKIINFLFFMIIGVIAVSSLGYAVSVDLNPLSVIPGISSLNLHSFPTGETLATFSFAAMTWENGEENMGGLNSGAYFAPIDWITTFPALRSPMVTDEDLVTLHGTYVMAAQKKFIPIYTTQDTFKMEAKSQGEIDGQSLRLEGEFFYPGTKAECRAFARKINATRGVIVGKTDDGERVVYGTKDRPVYFKANVNYGVKAADRKGITVSCWTDSLVPGYMYNGVIPLSTTDDPAIS